MHKYHMNMNLKNQNQEKVNNPICESGQLEESLKNVVSDTLVNLASSHHIWLVCPVRLTNLICHLLNSQLKHQNIVHVFR